MNTMAHLGALVALLWLSVSLMINTLGETELGVAFLIVFVMFIPNTIRAVADDIADWQGRNKDKKG